MSEKKFEITYGDEAKKVIGPIGSTSLLNSGLLGDVRKVVLCMYDKLDDGIHEHIIKVAKEQGCGSLFAIDKQALVANALFGAGACIALRREAKLYRKAFERLDNQEESEERQNG